MFAQAETVMQKLDAHAKILHARSQSGADDAASTAESLAIMADAILRIARDIRMLKLQLADRS